MISYTFIFDEETRISFKVEENADTSEEQPGDEVPAWLALGNHKCDLCTFPAGSRKTCPAALSIRPVVEAFSTRLSYEEVMVIVGGSRGRLETTLATQAAVRSLAGLLMALSACPVMRKLRPMAHYHVPFGTREHTMFRYVGMYLTAQYLRSTTDREPDWTLKGLLQLFRELHQVNKQLAERIRDASVQDATVNSIIFLDTFATAAELDVEESLADLLPLFSAHLDR
ncbi:MAG: hypothetical protein ABI333_09940 [bacterium]